MGQLLCSSYFVLNSNGIIFAVKHADNKLVQIKRNPSHTSSVMEFRQAGIALLQTYSTANQSNHVLVHLIRFC